MCEIRHSAARLTHHAHAQTRAMLHCSVICSLMIAIFICEQSGTYRMVDVAMLSFCSTDSPGTRSCALLAERRA
ncbi:MULTISPECIES: hypothetical protein [Xanthomonas]|uniref:Uncharacterized protein n=2 Tax=Xanthomonas TaxID=338 RepID=A0AA44Z1V3_XANCM|nr:MULTISPECIES: hypothetical protein [Xanthomonas]WVK06061.1 hypothetical protein KWH09_00880 [Xanthomonas campestris pv. olitorii]ASM99471.1 hypothetical protein APY29_01080 [Xanthomonas citri pv. malvacearum]ASN07663.1 hypothetical protein APY30_00920 [Xanthomonas citri pv. malvacearum]ASY82862.1 hypothetical protein CIW71_01175 [Xanthomonas citri pv. malvacearum]ASY90576.1 hypothetical protein CIW72_21610 [Xanthomonas citri pv. malvacearum]